MKELNKTYEPHIFDGAGHGFLRQQDGKNGANLKATQEAWPGPSSFCARKRSEAVFRPVSRRATFRR
jgi:dienelactone hydrolase